MQACSTVRQLRLLLLLRLRLAGCGGCMRRGGRRRRSLAVYPRALAHANDAHARG